jgi:hypothetical protein
MNGLLTGPLVFWPKKWAKFGAPYLGIAAEIVDVVAAEVAEEQRAPIPAIVVLVAGQREEWVELRACRWNDAADPVRLAGHLRAADIRLELNDRKRLVIVAALSDMLRGPMPAQATELIAIELAFARVPSGQSRRYEVPSKSVSASVQPATVGPREARGIVGIAVTIGSGREMPDLHGKIDICLQRRPRDKVVELGGIVLRMEN